MIDPKELRLGNIVAVAANMGHTNRIFRVVSIEAVRDAKAYNIGLLSLDGKERTNSREMTIDPIPLTKQRLERFGLTDSLLQYAIQKNITGEGYIVYSGHNCMYVKIKYVHQLQNLYFALTDEELTPASAESHFQ